MNWNGPFVWFIALVAAAIWAGCGDGRRAGADDDEQSSHGEKTAEHGFKKGHGVFASEEIRRTIGLELGEPVEKVFSKRIEGLARIYGTGKATVLLLTNDVDRLTIGQGVEFKIANDRTLTGTLARIDRQLERSTGQIEALVEFTPHDSWKLGSAVPVVFPLEGEQGVAVPQSSVLRTGEGEFVFTANGDHLQRTRVQTGTVEDRWVQITDGLLAGDVVATNGVQGLWCIELQATKGGAACCPAPLGK